LPGKPLLDIAGKPMVVRVAERAQRKRGRSRRHRDRRRADRRGARAHGVDAVMTRAITRPAPIG
jgi:3-deoxy-manno-octulosonate cytidylyltransferase (CMP-KDO synthetase)